MSNKLYVHVDVPANDAKARDNMMKALIDITKEDAKEDEAIFAGHISKVNQFIIDMYASGAIILPCVIRVGDTAAGNAPDINSVLAGEYMFLIPNNTDAADILGLSCLLNVAPGVMTGIKLERSLGMSGGPCNAIGKYFLGMVRALRDKGYIVTEYIKSDAPITETTN